MYDVVYVDCLYVVVGEIDVEVEYWYWLFGLDCDVSDYWCGWGVVDW